jgi:hypothetical protein
MLTASVIVRSKVLIFNALAMGSAEPPSDGGIIDRAFWGERAANVLRVSIRDPPYNTNESDRIIVKIRNLRG